MILVTGATGFIGNQVVEALLKSGKKIRCFVRAQNDLKENSQLNICVGDITDKYAVEKAVRGCNVIIHLAAILNPYDKNIFNVNVVGTNNIVNAAKKFGVNKFIFISTELVVFKKKDDYANTKSLAEKIVKRFKNHMILRLTAVYGKNCRGNISKLFNTVQTRKLVPVIGSGKNLIQPVYVEDVVNCILDSIKYGEGTYIVAGPESISLNEFIDQIAEKLSKKIIKIHLSFWLIYFLVKVYNIFTKQSLLSPEQLLYLRANRTYDMSETIKCLKFKPTNLNKGLFLTIKK